MPLKKTLTNLYTINALLLMLLPLILIAVTGDVRVSISDYAYSNASNLLVVLLTISAFLFIYNGFTSSKIYNVVLGLLLIGIALTPHLDYPIMHYSFATFFFIGSVYTMIQYSSKQQRIFKIIAGLITLLSLLGGFLDYYSFLMAEWIGILPICIHFIGEALNKID